MLKGLFGAGQVNRFYIAASENGGAFRRVGDVIFSIDREVSRS